MGSDCFSSGSLLIFLFSNSLFEKNHNCNGFQLSSIMVLRAGYGN